jgi:hypothetical protein
MKKPVFPVFHLTLLLSLAACLSARAVPLSDRTNVCSYGAIPNDGLDDTSAINNAINAGRSIYFPPGTYNYAGSMNLPANTSYRLYGDGPDVSTIIFTGTNAGINGWSMGPNTLNVDGLTLAASSANCGTAITAKFSESGSNTKFHTATIHNVQIIGYPRTGSGYWTNGIYLYKAQNSVIDKVEITGTIFTDSFGGTQTGIVWESSNDYATTGLQITNFEIKFADTAVRTLGWVEGFYMTGFEVVLCGQHGVPAVDLSSFDPNNRKPSFHLVSGHIQSIEQGLRLGNLSDVRISKVNFAHAAANDQHDYTLSGTIVNINNCLDVVVSGCTFYGWPVPNENGVFLDNSHGVRIAGNYFFHMQPTNGSCIVVLANSDTARITDNLFNDVRNRYIDYAPPGNTYYRGNN